MRSWYEVITTDGLTTIVQAMSDGSIYCPDIVVTREEFTTAVVHNRAHRLVRADAAFKELNRNG